MRRRAVVGGIGAAVLLTVGAGVWVQTLSGHDGRVVVSPDADPVLGGAATPLAELDGVMDGRRPRVFVGLPWVVAVAGTDFEAGWEETLLAVSEDEGASFRSVEVTAPVAYPSVVVHEDRAVLAGYRCAEPADGDSVCEPSAKEQLAFEIDLAAGTLEPVEPPPIEGTIYGAVGAAGDRSVFFAQTAEGETIVTREPDGTWTTSAAPAGTNTICPVRDELVAVTSAAPLRPRSEPDVDDQDTPATVPGGSDMREVGQGEPLWAAAVSGDGGATWSTPVPSTSQLEHDLSFTMGVTCGPRYVMANTAQLAVFDAQARRWDPIALPSDVELAPGIASAWASPERLVTWTTSSSTGPLPTAGPDGRLEQPERQVRVVGINGIGTTDVAASTEGTVDVTTGGPSGGLSPSAQAAGYVLDVGDTVTLGRVR